MADYSKMHVVINGDKVMLSSVNDYIESTDLGEKTYKKLIVDINDLLCRAVGGTVENSGVQVVVNKRKDLRVALDVAFKQSNDLGYLPVYTEEVRDETIRKIWLKSDSGKDIIRIYFPTKLTDWGWDIGEKNSRTNLKVVSLQSIKGN